MDQLTHTATGLFLSRAGLNRWTPQAAPILMLAANAPDIDIVTLSGGSLNYLHWHRNLTHSLVAMPLMALLAVGLVRLVGRKRVHWPGAFAAAMIAVASHLLLDWTNAYGIRLLLPFSDRWLRLDLNSLVDPWIWGAALLAIGGPMLGRLVASEISSGSSRPRHFGRGFACFALAFILLYDCGRFVLHARAVATLDAHIYQGSAPSRVAAFPGPNPLQWHGLVEAPDFIALADVDLTKTFHPTEAAVFPKPEPDPALEAARRTPVFQEFLRFSQFPFWRISPATDLENGRVVELLDLRFGTPLAPAFMASALVNSDLRVARTDYHWGMPRPK